VEISALDRTLLYRLQVLQVNIPPEKRGKILFCGPILLKRATSGIATQLSDPSSGITETIMARYVANGKHHTLRINECNGPLIGPEHLPANIVNVYRRSYSGLQPEKQQLPMKDIKRYLLQEPCCKAINNIDRPLTAKNESFTFIANKRI
jgi:hypothetical protein